MVAQTAFDHDAVLARQRERSYTVAMTQKTGTASNVCDLELETVEWTRKWIADLGHQATSE